jgi:hypothetical protein
MILLWWKYNIKVHFKAHHKFTRQTLVIETKIHLPPAGQVTPHHLTPAGQVAACWPTQSIRALLHQTWSHDHLIRFWWKSGHMTRSHDSASYTVGCTRKTMKQVLLASHYFLIYVYIWPNRNIPLKYLWHIVTTLHTWRKIIFQDMNFSVNIFEFHKIDTW